MDQLTFTLLLDYLYHKFAVTFVICIIGVMIKVISNTIGTGQKISISKMIASTMFSTVLMCAIGEFVYINFSLYVLLSVVIGMWSNSIISFALNSKFMSKLLLKYFKKTIGPVAKTISEALEEEDTEDKKQDENNNDDAYRDK